jgi:hypothetical protein
MITRTAWERWHTTRSVVTTLAFGALLAACTKQDIAVGEDKSRQEPAASALPTGGGVSEQGLNARSDQKMVPGLDQGHTPGPADTTMPLKPGVPPLDDAGAAPRPPPPRIAH